jgi:transcriptional regulator with XRE-family HTH domain
MNLAEVRKQRASQLKSLRLKKRLSRVALSELSGLNRTTIIRLETGNAGWNVDSELIYIFFLSTL